MITQNRWRIPNNDREKENYLFASCYMHIRKNHVKCTRYSVLDNTSSQKLSTLISTSNTVRNSLNVSLNSKVSSTTNSNCLQHIISQLPRIKQTGTAVTVKALLVSVKSTAYLLHIHVSFRRESCFWIYSMCEKVIIWSFCHFLSIWLKYWSEISHIYYLVLDT